jgi:LysM repeat protein
MSEGGMLEWKRQQLKLVKTADYSEIQKPLPKLPNDCEWNQDKVTKEWRVVSIPKSNTTGTVEQDDSSLLGQNQTLSTTHKVLPTDTIQGICLKYKISPHELRKANHFTGDNLYLAPETLIIPTKNVIDPKSVKMSQFLQAVSQSSKKSIGEKEAIAYLDINNWDVDIAVNMAMDDLIYESSMTKS